MNIYLSPFLSVSVCSFLSIYLYIYLSISPSLYLFIYLLYRGKEKIRGKIKLIVY